MFKFFRSERGQGLVEYALLILLIAVVVVVSLYALGVDIGTFFGEVETAFP